MNARLPLVAALLGGALVAPAAGAATPTSCRLVTDPRGDGRNTGYTSTPADGVYSSTDLDLLSADVATDARNVTVVLRLATLRATDPDSPTGKEDDFSFVAAEQRYVLTAFTGPDGSSAYVYALDGEDVGDKSAGARPGGPSIGRATVVWDYARREVRMTASLSTFAPYTGGGGTEVAAGYGPGGAAAVSVAASTPARASARTPPARGVA